MSRSLDVVTLNDPKAKPDETTDFEGIPFSCPAARRVLSLSDLGSEKLMLVMGDEYSVLYSLAPPPQSPKVLRSPTASNPSTSPRASATRRSPQIEMSSMGKRRKSSLSGSGAPGEKLELRPVWRVRQGFGTVLVCVGCRSATLALTRQGHGARVRAPRWISVTLQRVWSSLHAEMGI